MAWNILLLTCIVLVTPALLTPVIQQDLALPEYTCKVEPYIPVCTYTKIRLTHENYNFIAKADWIPSSFDIIYIEESTIPVFSSDICDTFSHISGIWIYASALEIFVPGALDSCISLRGLVIEDNNLKRIQPDLFQYNPKVQIIAWMNSGLEVIDRALFNGLNLWGVYLGGNRLKKFQFNWLADSERLEQVWVHSNHLTDLGLNPRHINRFKNLTTVAYNGNRIACSRVAEMNKLLKENLINISTHKEQPTDCPFEIGQVGGIDCAIDGSESDNARSFAEMNDLMSRFLFLLQNDSPSND